MPYQRELSEIEARRMWFYKRKSEHEKCKNLNYFKITIDNGLSKKELYGKHKCSGFKKEVIR